MEQLASSELWQFGASFLTKDTKHWPEQPSLTPSQRQEAAKEFRTKVTIRANFAVTDENPILKLSESCSSYNKILRSTAYVLRFIDLLKSKRTTKKPKINPFLQFQNHAVNKRSGPITAEEMGNAEILQIRLLQHLHFGKEIKT